MNWNLKGGVIIIGSLFWQDYLNQKDDNVRLTWRNSYLDIENKIAVRVPIRYGRKSNSGIMTMVFSNRMVKRNGFGYVVPFNKPINNSDELLTNCRALSTAEGMKGDFIASWGGVLAYMVNETMDTSIKREVIKLFKQQKNDTFDVREYKVGREKSCITKSLKLNIKQVVTVLSDDKSRLDELHFLLATATKPINKIPTPKEIAETVKSDQQRRYFMNNLANGIISHDDFEIAKYL